MVVMVFIEMGFLVFKFLFLLFDLFKFDDFKCGGKLIVEDFFCLCCFESKCG